MQPKVKDCKANHANFASARACWSCRGEKGPSENGHPPHRAGDGVTGLLLAVVAVAAEPIAAAVVQGGLPSGLARETAL